LFLLRFPTRGGQVHGFSTVEGGQGVYAIPFVARGRVRVACSRARVTPTGHAHTPILRGVLDDGRILNIAGDYIAHGVRHRASELVTQELGHQSEIELQTKLQNEVAADRLTRLDKMLLSEQR
jgi:hypothetical protein